MAGRGKRGERNGREGKERGTGEECPECRNENLVTILYSRFETWVLHFTA